MMRFNGLARGCATARFAGGCRAISEFAGAPPTGAGLPSTSPVRAAAKPGRGPYHIEGMPFPKIRHESFPQYKESIFWDAKEHLQFEWPECIASLDKNITRHTYPATKEQMNDGMAYSAPFRVLSDKGEAALRSIIDGHKIHITTNDRQKGGILRGLGYMSKYVECFVYDKEFLANISEIAGEPLAPTCFGSHLVQVNFGPPGIGAEVDKWHFDSVDYVLVIVLSDITNMLGGDLQLLKKQLGGKDATLEIARHGIPEALVETQSYQRSGYGILCQGSKILHRVSPVLSAKEDRISFVISLAKTNAFGEDNARTLKYCKDHKNVIAWEMARHEAWRQQGVLDWIIQESDPNVTNPMEYAEILERSAERLKRAAAICRDEYDDALTGIGWSHTDSNYERS